ncbi:MAG: hypothetical protein KY476_07925 [Planctomycetes bacterium]|nr:hypothetical protein [Planctomycetota bacterium]
MKTWMPMLLVVASLAATPELYAAGDRVWTAYNGQTVRARFIGINGENVQLRQDRRPVSIPYHQLIKSDREHVRAELAKRGRERDLPFLGESRTWTHGGETFSGQFVKPDRNRVILLRDDKPVTLPYRGFGLEDQQYIQNTMQSNGQAHLMAALLAGQDGAGNAADGAAAAGMPAGNFPSFGNRGPAGERTLPTYDAGAGPSYGHGAAGASTPGYTGTFPNPAGMPAGASGSPYQQGYAGTTAAGNVPTYTPGSSQSSTTAPPSYAPQASVPGYDATADAGHGASFPEPPQVPDFASSMPTVPSYGGGSSSGYSPSGEIYTKQCRKCGKLYPESATYCTNCRRRGGGWRMYKWIAIVVVLVVGGIAKAIKGS